MLAQGEAPLSLHALTERSGLPKPTVYRILRSLCALGYAEPLRGASAYRVTGKVYELIPVDADGWLRERVLPEMEALHAELNETVNLACLDGFKVRYVRILESTQPLRCVPDDRSHDEVLRTALGRAVAAYLPEEEMREKVPRLCELAGYADVAAMFGELQQTRRRGWAMESEQGCPGVDCIAVPLLEEGTPYAGVSVSVPSVRMERPLRNRLVKRLKQLAARVHAAQNEEAGVV